MSGYTFSATGLPTGLSISSSGIITGTPTATTTTPDTVVVTAIQGSCQASATYYLTVNPFLGGKVVSFTLVDARTGKDLHPLSEGEVLNLLQLPDQLSIRANTDPMEVGSVVFNLNGKARFQVENFAPYALASNKADDSYVPYAFQPGDYTLSATSYSQANGQGQQGLALTVHFQVVSSRVASFTLIDAATGGEVQPLQEGDVLDLAALPPQLSIRANTQPQPVGSVVFDLNGKASVRVENVVPYALASNQPDAGLAFHSQFGSQGSGEGQFFYPTGVAVDGPGNLYVADAGNHRIQKFDSSGHFLRQFGGYGSGEGQFNYPTGVAADGRGNLFVADGGNNRIQKFDASGRFLSQFGSLGYSKGGEFYNPTDVAVDGSGNLYVADLLNYRIQKFDSSGHFLSLFGSFGSGQGQFDYAYNVAVDGRGRVYVSDGGNHRIQKFDSSGHFLLQFGGYGSGQKQFQGPVGLATDGSDNLYVTDANNNRIQKFDSSGQFLTQFGSLGSGEGEFFYPRDVAVDRSGELYVADWNNHRIQRLSPLGSYGPYLPYGFQVGKYALRATPYSQVNEQGMKGQGLTVNFRVVNSASTARISAGEGPLLEVTAYPNPFGGQLYAVIKSTVSQPVAVHCYDAKGREISGLYQGELQAGQGHRIEVDGRSWPDGLYFLRVSTPQQQLVKKVLLLRK